MYERGKEQYGSDGELAWERQSYKSRRYWIGGTYLDVARNDATLKLTLYAASLDQVTNVYYRQDWLEVVARDYDSWKSIHEAVMERRTYVLQPQRRTEAGYLRAFVRMVRFEIEFRLLKRALRRDQFVVLTANDIIGQYKRCYRRGNLIGRLLFRAGGTCGFT